MKPPSSRAVVVFALMLALHALVGWMLVASSSRPKAPPVPVRVAVFVLPWVVRPPPLEPVERAPTEPEARSQRARPLAQPSAAFAPLQAPAAVADAGAGVAAAEPAASEPQVGPLNLDLPRTRDGQRGSARALLGEVQTPGSGFGERLARALGTDQALIEQPLNGDSVRLRKGTDCVVVSRSRESQLDPFNQSVNPSARGVTPCR